MSIRSYERNGLLNTEDVSFFLPALTLSEKQITPFHRNNRDTNDLICRSMFGQVRFDGLDSIRQVSESYSTTPKSAIFGR